jgi:DNA polymerase III subunit gamma/tau
MSYLVLARKYRPRLFADMVGQEAVVQALSNALVQQRLHHAYLFTGTRGVGKTTVARILAKSLNCLGADGQGDVTATPCGACDACRDIGAGRFVDYTELDAASNRGVAEIQALLEQAAYKPVQGRFKVFMIDEVHMLSNHAFNSMLKTLEEPPAYLKFVLATTDPQKVPVTVLSRCLQFNLRPMMPETVHAHLAAVLRAEQIEFDDDALAALSVAARGSMRDALSLADQSIAFGGGQLRGQDVRHMLGLVGRDKVLDVLDALVAVDGAALMGHVDALRMAGASAASVLEDLCTVLHRIAVAQVASVAEGAGPAGLDSQRVAALSQALPADETQLLYSICLHGRAELGLAPDEYAGLAMVLLRGLAFRPQPAYRAPAEKKSLNSAPAPKQQAQAAPVFVAPASVAPASVAPGENDAAAAAAPTDHRTAGHDDPRPIALAELPVRDEPVESGPVAATRVGAAPVPLDEARTPVSALPIVQPDAALVPSAR